MPIFPNLYLQLRSQAIYGGLVETYGPYSQDYTKTIFNFYLTILPFEILSVNKTRMIFPKQKLMFGNILLIVNIHSSNVYFLSFFLENENH
jgi:hypothetical protein